MTTSASERAQKEFAFAWAFWNIITALLVTVVYFLQPDPFHKPMIMVDAMRHLGIGSLTIWALAQHSLYTFLEWNERWGGKPARSKCDGSTMSLLAIARATCCVIVIACMHYMHSIHDDATSDGSDIRLRPMMIGALLTYGWLLGLAVADDLPYVYRSTCWHLSFAAALCLIIWWITRWPIVHWCAITTMMCIQNVILSIPFPRPSVIGRIAQAPSSTSLSLSHHHHHHHHHHIRAPRVRGRPVAI